MAVSPPSSESWRVSSPQPRSRYAAPVLSVLLHVLLAVVWLGFPMPELSLPEIPPAVNVDIVPAPPTPPAPAPTPAPAPAAAAPATAAPRGMPQPQLAEGELAPKSSPVPETEDRKPAPPDPPATIASPKPKKPAPVTQNEHDWVLSRVLRHWQPPAGLSQRDGTISLKVRVQADGYFADIYDARRPWNPVEVFDGYSALAPGSLERRTIDAVYTALRKAQPLALPRILRDKAPFDLRLGFRFKDAR